MGFYLMMLGASLIVAVPIAAYLFYTAHKYGMLAKASARWLSTQGKILESRVEEKVSHTTNATLLTYLPVVRYEYMVHGVRYEGDVIEFGMGEDSRQARAEAVVAKRAVGAAVRVHYNPHDPQTATLDTSSRMANSRFKTAVFLLIGLPAVMLAMAWFVVWLG